MNNYFNVKRFWKYFCFDLQKSWSNFGLSAILLGLSPILAFILVFLVNLVFRGGAGSTQVLSVPVMAMAVIATIISFPQKVYGNLTEKKAGSSFLMIPASTLEKWLSMLLILCVVLPFVFSSLLLGSDALLGIIVPSYGSSIASTLSDAITRLHEAADEIMDINFGFSFYGNWCKSILTFGLGAICFKRAKAAKTILFIAALCTVLMFIAFTIFGQTHISSEDLQKIIGTVEGDHFVKVLKGFVISVSIITYSILLGGLYFRLKTMKH